MHEIVLFFPFRRSIPFRSVFYTDPNAEALRPIGARFRGWTWKIHSDISAGPSLPLIVGCQSTRHTVNSSQVNSSAGVPENRTSPHITAHHCTSPHINRTSPEIKI